MADIDAEFCQAPGAVPATREERTAQLSFGGASPEPVVTTYYQMRGVDPDCVELTYRAWVVPDQPDYAGAHYAGARCGVSALTDVVVLVTWTA